MLDHQYTKAGLSFGVLKGRDRSFATALLRAQERARVEGRTQFDVHLAIVEKHVSGSAEYDDDDYYGERYGYRRYCCDDEEDEDDEDDEDEDGDEQDDSDADGLPYRATAAAHGAAPGATASSASAAPATGAARSVTASSPAAAVVAVPAPARPAQDLYTSSEDDESSNSDQENSDSGHVIEDVIEEDVSATDFIAPDDKELPLSVHVSEESQIWPPEPFGGRRFREEYEGYQGNYGPSVERWYVLAQTWVCLDSFLVSCFLLLVKFVLIFSCRYRSAALVVWLRRDRVVVVSGGGFHSMVTELTRLQSVAQTASQGEIVADLDSLVQACLKQAKEHRTASSCADFANLLVERKMTAEFTKLVTDSLSSGAAQRC